MKHLLPFLLLVTGWGTQGWAQTQALLDQPQWYVNAEAAQLSSFDFYTTGKDTLLHNKVWHQLLIGFQPLPVYLREEAGSERVFIASAWDGWQERLLYDFGTVVGDTLLLQFRHQGTQRFVVQQTSVLFTTQGSVPAWELANLDGGQPATLQWGAGIGDLDHPAYLDYLGQADTLYHLICNYHQRQKFYDDGFGNCPGIPPPLNQLDPVSEPVQIQVENRSVTIQDWKGKNGKWSLSSTNGTTRSGNLRFGRNELSWPELPAGLYVLRIQGTHSLVVKKMIWY